MATPGETPIPFLISIVQSLFPEFVLKQFCQRDDRVLGVFAVGLGTIIRNSAGAITTLFGLVLVLPVVLQALPTSLRDSIEKFLPGNAGQAIFHTVKDTSSLSPWLGIAVFAIYAAASLGIGLVLVRRRDA